MANKSGQVVVVAALALVTGGLLWGEGAPLVTHAFAAEGAVTVPAPVVDQAKGAEGPQVAVLAGGCFWGVQGVFQHVNGVISAVSGYSGGEAATAQYETVSRGNTGHAESVKITYDPQKISYGEILRIYFSVVADPTTLNFQGPDYGSQYRTEIFTSSDDQAKVAAAYIKQLDAAHVWSDKIVTKVEPVKGFYPAEAYHQDFLTLNPSYPYIAYNDIPKVEALQKLFPADWRDKPVLVNPQKS